MAQVVIDNLTKVFSVPRGAPVLALDRANLTVANGEFLVLTGPSGCGKSTLLRLLAGLEAPTSGDISLDGRSLNGVAARDRNLALVFQSHALYPHLTAFENLAFGLRVRGLPRPEITRRIHEAATLLQLTDCLGRLPRELSGGQRQRVALGRAIVRQPAIFLFDEPLSHLDATLRIQLRREIRALHHQLGTTMIYVTHDQVEALTLGDRLAVMQAGTIHQVAPPLDLYHSPANRFVAGFLGSPPMSFFRGTLIARNDTSVFVETLDAPAAAAGEPFTLALPASRSVALAAHADRPLLLGVRPEHLSPAPMDSRAAPESALLYARVEAVDHLGAETHWQLRSAGHSFTLRSAGTAPTPTGATVNLSFPWSMASFFDATSGQALC